LTALSNSPVRTNDRFRRIGVVAAVVLAVAGLLFGAFLLDDGSWAVIWLAYALVGGVILFRSRGNNIGRLLIGIGLCWAWTFVAMVVIERLQSPTSVWVEMLSSVAGYWAWGFLILIPVLFPTGRPSDRFTRWLQVGVMITIGLVSLAEFISQSPKELTGTVSPVSLPLFPEIIEFLLDGGFILVPLLLVASLWTLVARWRRSTGAERLQYRWFIGSIILVAITLGAVSLVPEEVPFLDLAFVVIDLIPLAIGIAVLRYRLYEIDRVVSRTVGYGLVIGILAFIYIVAAVWLPSQVIGQQPDLFVAGATLMVAAMFAPLRKRVLAAVDRRFYRTRYDSELLVLGFSRQVGNQVDIDLLVDDWLEVVSQTMQPTSAGVWVRPAADPIVAPTAPSVLSVAL
jgi:hypothetical protein